MFHWGGVGNLNELGLIIGLEGQGYEKDAKKSKGSYQLGHVYIRRDAFSNKDGFRLSSLLMGVESTAPLKQSPFLTGGKSHGITSGIQDETLNRSASGGQKWAVLLPKIGPASFGGMFVMVNPTQLELLTKLFATVLSLPEIEQAAIFKELLVSNAQEARSYLMKHPKLQQIKLPEQIQSTSRPKQPLAVIRNNLQKLDVAKQGGADKTIKQPIKQQGLNLRTTLADQTKVQIRTPAQYIKDATKSPKILVIGGAHSRFHYVKKHAALKNYYLMDSEAKYNPDCHANITDEKAIPNELIGQFDYVIYEHLQSSVIHNEKCKANTLLALKPGGKLFFNIIDDDPGGSLTAAGFVNFRKVSKIDGDEISKKIFSVIQPLWVAFDLEEGNPNMTEFYYAEKAKK